MTGNVRWIQGLSNDTKESVRDFYYQPDIYTMPGNVIITIWTESGEQILRKYYLTMFIWEAYISYLQWNIYVARALTCVCYSTFNYLHLKNMLLMILAKRTLFVVYENLFFKLDTISISSHSTFWNNACNIEANSDCWGVQIFWMEEWKEDNLVVILL